MLHCMTYPHSCTLLGSVQDERMKPELRLPSPDSHHILISLDGYKRMTYTAGIRGSFGRALLRNLGRSPGDIVHLLPPRHAARQTPPCTHPVCTALESSDLSKLVPPSIAFDIPDETMTAVFHTHAADRHNRPFATHSADAPLCKVTS